MKQPPSYALVILLLTLAASGVGFWYYHQLEQLNTQLAYSASLLTTENKQTAKWLEYALNNLRSAVEKNRNQPADLIRLHRAETLHAQVVDLLASLHACDSLVRRSAGWTTSSIGRQPLVQQPFADGASPVAQRWQKLRRQLSACNNSLYQFSPPGALPVLLPGAAPSTTVVQAVADLASTEQQLLFNEASVLHRVAKALARRPLLFEPLALAIAERNVVAPGGTYHARLLLATHLPADVHQSMGCNGQSVPVGPDGVGLVRFRAPTKPGPASWAATIHIDQNGRDTTFAVRVPYRVARR